MSYRMVHRSNQDYVTVQKRWCGIWWTCRDWEEGMGEEAAFVPRKFTTVEDAKQFIREDSTPKVKPSTEYTYFNDPDTL